MLTIFKAQSFLILTVFFFNWTKTSKGEIEYKHHIFFNLKYFHNFSHGEIIA